MQSQAGQSGETDRSLLEAVRGGPARTGAGDAILRVRDVRVAPAFEGRGFVYRTSEFGYSSDFYHEFFIAPRAQFSEQTRRWLGASGLFRIVIDPASKMDATQTIEGNVSELYGDFRDPSAPKAVLAVEFFLSNDQPAASAVVFHKAYRREVPLDNRAPESLAKGWGKALEQILTALEQDLSQIRK
jgi:cholesterol transport system auxiliary component